jgi:hypothetical protein
VHCAGDNVSYGYRNRIPSLGKVLLLGFLLIKPKLCNIFEDDRINCNDVRFEVFTAVTVKKAVFWDVAFLETSVYTISTRRHIPEDGILQNFNDITILQIFRQVK